MHSEPTFSLAFRERGGGIRRSKIFELINSQRANN
jgi:hypothetical protein